jgi:hypothetical protein
MDQDAWVACDLPDPMFSYLDGRITDRKGRLFGCACCRRGWHLTTDLVRHAIELAERYADGLVAESEVDAAVNAAFAARGLNFGMAHAAGPDGTCDVCVSAVWAVAEAVANAAAHPVRDKTADIWAEAHARERRIQADLFRDIFGNPFRPPVFEPAWVTDPVARLAQAAYDDREMPAGTLRPSPLAAVAAALEDAGCDNEKILGHLRSPGPHVRGCHIVDHLLHRE